MSTAEAPELSSTTVSFNINRSDWFGLLGDVMPFAGDDDCIPVLTVVAVEIDGKRITARATDRFTFGRAWFEAEKEIGKVTALIPVREIQAAIKLHPAHKRGLPQKELSISIRALGGGDENVETNLSVDTGTISITSGGVFDAKVTSEHKLYSGKFVSIDKLIPTRYTGTPEIGWNPDLMAKFGRVRRHGNPLQVRFSGENRPIRVDIGPQFTGCIMPARLRDEVRVA